MIPYARQSIDASDVEAVVEVLRSDWLTQGPCIPAFEAALGAAVGAPHVVAVSSGTAGLHLACMALGIGVNDHVWTSPLSFAASANCALYCGAKVDFIDIDPRTGLICLDALSHALKVAAIEGRLPKALIVVHYAGLVADMSAISRLADLYGFRIIEDAAHALGAGSPGVRVGDCRYSDMTIFSFHPVKHITTGEGGAVCMRDSALARQVALLRSHGITRDEALMEGESEGGWYYQQTALGLNYRITDLQAALGRSQLARLEGFIAQRRRLAERYEQLLQSLPVRRLPLVPDAAWHLYPIRVEPCRRKAVFDTLRSAGINVNVHYLPIYLHPYYRRLGFRPGHCPQAEAFYAGLISLPMYADLDDDAQERVVHVLKEALA
ncbi:UDP-4-amino-4,6-dideoxy-N-acetyl-beta-L-altrosamine transaminase [Pseudomonas sp. PA1(2017)]|uniref:UDP-4-amino-4, 6-dideoxy-N-acetyl-beta-L-altrosamine transaminase n=1 Tax=Pseudomonas sp. PA1(2017) TaxID=1932113 RepID=UPI00095974EA|nr:UDP-4-amino-4,6-dideoxy-N-acetyl-beta-L-altrosamine transaminase [Pseudomonas sp. PA1(2017)]OLU15090.1 UDP-4-amino-4,6-dideoxy-N-acetyl-beta-L-altrosamine transaminase [Pseudomonas sp. PA1(2017)]